MVSIYDGIGQELVSHLAEWICSSLTRLQPQDIVWYWRSTSKPLPHMADKMMLALDSRWQVLVMRTVLRLIAWQLISITSNNPWGSQAEATVSHHNLEKHPPHLALAYRFRGMANVTKMTFRTVLEVWLSHVKHSDSVGDFENQHSFPL